MGIVAYIPQAVFHSVDGVQQVADTKNIGRNGNRHKKQIEVHIRTKQDGGIYDSGYGTTGAHGTVEGFVLMKVKRQEVSRQQTAHIKQQKMGSVQLVYHHTRKKEKRNHVKEQVRHVYMQKPGAEHSDVFAAFDASYIELVFFKKCEIPKSFKRQECIGRNNNQRSKV